MTSPRPPAAAAGKPEGWTTMKGGMWIVLFILLGGVLVQHVARIALPGAAAHAKPWSIGVGIAAFLAVALLGLRPASRRFLGSVRFAAPVLVFVTVLGLLGTLVVQGEPRETFVRLYGATLAWLFEMLHLQDLFHGFGFSAVLGAGAGGVLIALFPLRPFTPPRVARLMAHASLLVILLGAAIGALRGVKGKVGLLEGETASSFSADLPGGAGTREVPLGFTLRLDKFRLQRYAPSFRLRVFDVTGKEPRFVASADPAKGKEKDKLASFGLRIAAYWPDYEQVVEATPLDGKKAAPHERIAALAVAAPGGKGGKSWLFSDDTLPPERIDVPGGGGLAFVWSARTAEKHVEAGAGSPEEKHAVRIGDAETVVKVGGTYPVPGHGLSFTVEQFFNDFVIDMATKQPSNRSGRPDNPAIRVSFTDAAGTKSEGGWLFADFATFHSAKGGSPLSMLTYAYTPGKKEGAGDALVVGETREVWTVADGKVAAKAPLGVGCAAGIAGLGVAATDLLPAAKVVTKNATRSMEARNPVVEVALEGKEGTLLVPAGEPLRLSAREVAVLSEQEESIKDFLSTLSVIDRGAVVMTRTIEVNHPLAYGGYSFYQSDYDPTRPGWTGLQVVRDPGIGLVYAGLVLLLAGVALLVLVVPFVNRARAASAARG